MDSLISSFMDDSDLQWRDWKNSRDKRKDVEKQRDYLVFYLLINNCFYRIKIKLFKLHPFIEPPIDCEKRVNKEGIYKKFEDLTIRFS